MDERVQQFRVGVMVLAVLIITAILMVMFGKLPRMMGTYTLYARFNYAAGIADGTPVRKSGVLIGRVSNVELADHQEQVLVTLKINKNMAVYRNEDCYITRDSLVAGDAALSFIPDPEKKSLRGQRIPDGTELQGRVSDDPTGLKRALQGPINTVEETGEALKQASLQLGSAAKKVDELLDAERSRIHDVLDNAAESLKAMRTVLGDRETQQRLGEAMKKLPDTLDNMNETFHSADASLKAFTARSGPDQRTPVERMVTTIEMTERTLRKFSESSDPNKPPPADQIASAMENINEITGLMRQIMARIDRGDGSLGALLNDRQLYDRLNRAARNVEQVTRDVKPIIEDARVLSDKLKRHPGVILRDAVKPGSTIQ
ncbi:MAG: MlaD family protein [Planctomycetaceae bacterium]|nr:MlaD family protein [Planctomycetaceae bacterium]